MKRFSRLVLFFTIISFFGCSSDKPATDLIQRVNGNDTSCPEKDSNSDVVYKKISKGKLSLISEDITKMKVGAIVNAANQTLLGGGGVDGAIHVAAGPGLRSYCAAFPEISPGVRCNVGEAKITPGFNLPASNVIHTVGPVYKNYDDATATILLADCYTNSLKCAQLNGVRAIAFSCISTGIFGYPKDKAAHIALAAVRNFLILNDASFDEIIFVCYDGSQNYKIYESLL